VAEALSEVELGTIVTQQIELAKTHFKHGRELSAAKALDYYFGRMDKYVPPEPNRSKVVSRDVADVVGWLLPQLMRVFTASGRMFVAEPETPDDLQYAEQATDGLNYVFWKDNKGYEVVYSATWDALVHGDGIVKTFYNDTPVYGPTTYHEGLTEDQQALVAGDESVDVLAQTKRTAQVPDLETGEPTDQTVYDLKLRRKKAEGTFTVTVIPYEDFLIDADATSLEDAAFKAHWQQISRSALVAMGYDKDDVWSLPAASKNETPEAQARQQNATGGDSTDKSTELVDYYECFPRIDVDGDGVAELLRVCKGGGSTGKILDWEVWEDEDPFDNIPCEPIPHRWDSRSVADEEIDIQDVKTVLTRQMLNNTYWVNNPQQVVSGPGVLNPDALETATFGQPIFAKAGTTITPLPRDYIGDKALLGINYMDEVSQRRTGVGAQSMALDPETLQNQSATANQNAHDASMSQHELIARNMAEWGWTKVGRKLLRLMNKHQAGPRVILVKGKPVPIDPKSWNPDMHVTINVGLGTGSRDRDAGMLNTVLQQQMAYTDRIGQVFPEKALEMLPFIHNTLTRFAESTGLKNPELYWPEIDPNEVDQGKKILLQRQQQPDPKMQIEQMKAQTQLQIQQSEQASNNARAQAEIQKAQADAQVKMIEAQAAAQHAQMELQLAQAEMQIRQLEIAAKNDTERWKAELAAATQIAAAQAKAGFETQATILEAELDSELGFQSHQQNLAEAEQAHQHAMEQQAAAPKPSPNGAAP
jgi:hypothetical protein